MPLLKTVLLNHFVVGCQSKSWWFDTQVSCNTAS